jgi:DNA-binding MarR family transcriptional regulator
MTHDQQGVAMSRRNQPHVNELQKRDRAFAAYLDLLDAADLMREKMSHQIRYCGLTMLQFRVLATIYREGPQYQQELSRKLNCAKQNMATVVSGLVECGCLRREVSSLARTPTEGGPSPRMNRDAKGGAPSAPVGRSPRLGSGQAGCRSSPDRQGRRIIILRLTADGEDLIAYVFPRHAKLVKAEMRALEGREQAALSRLCRKLKEGNVIKLFKEIRMGEADLPWGRRSPTGYRL